MCAPWKEPTSSKSVRSPPGAPGSRHATVELKLGRQFRQYQRGAFQSAHALDIFVRCWQYGSGLFYSYEEPSTFHIMPKVIASLAAWSKKFIRANFAQLW